MTEEFNTQGSGSGSWVDSEAICTVKATQGDREVWEVNPDWTGCGKFERPGDFQKDAVRQGTWAQQSGEVRAQTFALP